MAKVDPKILKQLKAKAGAWDKAKARANDKQGDWENLPDGKYIAQLAGAEINNSQGESQRLQVKMEYVVKEGEQQGNSIFKYLGLDKEESLDWMAKELVRLGVDASQLSIEELPDVLEKLLVNKPTVRLKLRTKGEYQNCYIEKLVDSEDGAGDDASSETATDDAAEVVEDAEPAEAVVTVGETEVTFKLKGNDCQSVVLKVDDEKGVYMVEVDGKKYNVKQDACTIVEPEVVEDAAEEVEEVVEDVVEDAPAAKVKATPKPKAKVEPAPAVEEEVELAVGMKVQFKLKGKPVSGPVKKIDEKAGLVYVQIGKEIHKVKPDDLTMVPEGKDK